MNVQSSVSGKLTFGVVLVSLSLFVSPQSRAETIRVALVQQASQLQISSSKNVRLRFPSRKTSVVSVPLRILPSRNGIRINGKPTRSSHVIIQSRTGELSISSSQHNRQGSASSHPQRWSVSGVLEIHNQGTTLLAVNRVDLEAYVAGVVPSEISPKWPSEALKTQAVAARTYVLNKKLQANDQKYDVVASVQDQVYTGRSLVNQAIQKAIQETKGMVVTYERRPIFAAYSSTAAGPTEDAINVWDADLPYLKGVDCPFDEESPKFEWEATVGLRDLESQLRKAGYPVGTIATFIPLSFTRAGRVNEIRMLHSKGVLILRGQDFRKAVGYSVIPSTQFSIHRFGREVVFSGRGAGHGVGMCQWGAKEMAELGYRYESILQYYYPGTQLLHLRKVDLSPPELEE